MDMSLSAIVELHGSETMEEYSDALKKLTFLQLELEVKVSFSLILDDYF